jgi:hypothetical protein
MFQSEKQGSACGGKLSRNKHTKIGHLYMGSASPVGKKPSFGVGRTKGKVLANELLLAPSPTLMFTELRNWFRDVRRTPPGPLQYMRLGTEGRDVNPLMVRVFFPCDLGLFA